MRSRNFSPDAVNLLKGADRIAGGTEIENGWPARNEGDISDPQDRPRHLPSPGWTVDDDDLLFEKFQKDLKVLRPAVGVVRCLKQRAEDRRAGENDTLRPPPFTK